MSDAATLVKKLWNYCNVFRDDGMSYGDYVEQLTLLLYLKMSHERTQPPWSQPSTVPDGYDWPSLMSKDGLELDRHYRDMLDHLGKEEGMIGLIFRKSQNRIQDPSKLRRLIADLIDKENWISLDVDVKGDAYEGLLEKNAQDSKGGAGQYFTPRSVIQAIVKVMNPKPGMTISDPACGTGGFLLEAHDHIVKENPSMDRDAKEHLRFQALQGNELVGSVARLCAMNLSLHGIGNEEFVPIKGGEDSLRAHPGEYYDMVLTNPPFGTKSSVKIVTEGGDVASQDLTVEREDFWATTKNKQLMFLQHIISILKVGGKAAVVLPDNVLFEGGTGETIRRKFLSDCNLHTILRLPTGLFYAKGVKANVLFFDRKEVGSQNQTKKVWFYDMRTNKKFTLKARPMKINHLEEFITLYNEENLDKRQETWSENNPEGRWRAYSIDEILERDIASLDIFWLKDDSLVDLDSLLEPDELVEKITSDLEELQSLIEKIKIAISKD